MTTRVEFVRTWRARIVEQLNSLAHQSLASQLTFDAYNASRGRYKALKDIVKAFDDEIARIQGGDDDGAIGEPEPDTEVDDEEDAPARAVRRRQQRRQPRSWA